MDEKSRQDRIDDLSLKFQTEKSIAKRRVLWDEIKSLIKGRTPETVARMEKERGLA